MKQVSRQTIERAKAVVLREIGKEPWLRSVGIGLVAHEPGLVVGVAPIGERAARKALAGMKCQVPVRVQVLGQVRKRAAGS